MKKGEGFFYQKRKKVTPFNKNSDILHQKVTESVFFLSGTEIALKIH